MELSTFYYGPGALTTARRIGTHLTWVLVIFGSYGMWNDFIPSAHTRIYGGIAGLVVGAVLSVAFFLAWATDRWPVMHDNHPSKKRLVALVIPLVAVMFSWLTFVHGAPALITLAGGVNHTIEATMHKVRGGGRSCRFQLEGSVLDGAFPNHLCTSEQYFMREPKNVSIMLRGKESSFGFYIADFSESRR